MIKFKGESWPVKLKGEEAMGVTAGIPTWIIWITFKLLFKAWAGSGVGAGVRVGVGVDDKVRMVPVLAAGVSTGRGEVVVWVLPVAIGVKSVAKGIVLTGGRTFKGLMSSPSLLICK